jgi:antitoxin component of MazEF toxin-antitoxin module
MVYLKVKRAYDRDVGRKIVRIPSVIFEELGITQGDVVLIKGEKETVAKALRKTNLPSGLKKWSSMKNPMILPS